MPTMKIVAATLMSRTLTSSLSCRKPSSSSKRSGKCDLVKELKGLLEKLGEELSEEELDQALVLWSCGGSILKPGPGHVFQRLSGSSTVMEVARSSLALSDVDQLGCLFLCDSFRVVSSEPVRPWNN